MEVMPAENLLSLIVFNYIELFLNRKLLFLIHKNISFTVFLIKQMRFWGA